MTIDRAMPPLFRPGYYVTAALLLVACHSCSRRERAPRKVVQDNDALLPAPSSDAEEAERSVLTERRAEREHMVRSSLEAEGIRDPRVLAAFRRVPRHRFVPESVRAEAYANRPLPIGWGQTISQPYMVALMTAAAAPQGRDSCLEIGTGSGYQAAILAELCARVYSIEYLPPLADFARANLRALGYSSVELRTGDGYGGWPEAAPFDVIVVTAAPESVPPALLRQLSVGGRLVIPLGRQHEVQKLVSFLRRSADESEHAFERKLLANVRFVPFVGESKQPQP